MNERNENNRHNEGPERGIDSGSAVTCPAGNAWCHRHEADGDYCWSRTITIGEAQIAVSNGTHDGSPKLWGLSEFEEDNVSLEDARAVATAIHALVREVER